MSSLTNKIRHGDSKGAIEAIHAGANPNKTNASGNTPLHIAAEEDNLQVAEELLAHGAKGDLKNMAGKTAAEVRPGTSTGIHIDQVVMGLASGTPGPRCPARRL